MHTHATRSRSPLLSDSRHGFSLVELLTVIAIIGILAAILVPVISSVRETVNTATCSSRLRELYKAFRLYAVEHDDRVLWSFRQKSWNGDRSSMSQDRVLVTGYHWFQVPIILGYLGAPDIPHNTFRMNAVNSRGFYNYVDNCVKCYSVMGCPTVQDYGMEYDPVNDANANRVLPGGRDGMRNYMINVNTGNLANDTGDNPPFFHFYQYAQPSRTMLLTDWRVKRTGGDYTAINVDGRSRYPEAVHGNCANMVFADGHVECLDVDNEVPRYSTTRQSQLFWRGIYSD